MVFNKSKLIVIAFTLIIVAGITTSAIIGKKQDDQYAKNDHTYKQAEQAYEQGQYTIAIEHVTTLLQDDPTNEKLNTLGANAAYDANQFELAAQHYQAALDRNPHNVEKPLFMLKLATSYFESNQTGRAKVIFEYLQANDYNVQKMPDFQDVVQNYIQKINETEPR